MLKASATNNSLLVTGVLEVGQLKEVTISGTLDRKSVQICNLNILIILGNSLENKTFINKLLKIEVNCTNACG